VPESYSLGAATMLAARMCEAAGAEGEAGSSLASNLAIVDGRD
jgi:hypothetical protein